jgi:hypothetical protein
MTTDQSMRIRMRVNSRNMSYTTGGTLFKQTICLRGVQKLTS